MESILKWLGIAYKIVVELGIAFYIIEEDSILFLTTDVL